jgi:hypothetical protein
VASIAITTKEHAIEFRKRILAPELCLTAGSLRNGDDKFITKRKASQGERLARLQQTGDNTRKPE